MGLSELWAFVKGAVEEIGEGVVVFAFVIVLVSVLFLFRFFQFV